MFIAEHQRQWPVRVMCRVLRVHPSGYYAWKQRPAKRSSDDKCAPLLAMRLIHAESNRSAGTRTMVKELKNRNHTVGRKRVRRLMNEDGIVAKRTPRLRRVATTDSDHHQPLADNLVNRNFTPGAPNTVWSCDITYIRTAGGFVYLAVVMDLYSRRIIGWHIAENMQQSLTIMALWKAWKNRGMPTGMIIHSDRGVQYAASAYRQFVTKRCKAQQSMSRKGNCWDNAPVESFFATLKIEGLDTFAYRDLEHVQPHVWQFIENRYNRKRLHSTLGYVTPIAFVNQ
jgi:putative transposase